MTSFTVYVPEKFNILVNHGDSVKAGQTLAEISTAKKSDDESITLYSLLEVKPEDAKKYLVKADGETVTKGEIIACKQGFFSSIRVKSPMTGILRVNKKQEGFVSIDSGMAASIKSPVRGVVVKTMEKVGIIIDSKRIVFTGLSGRGTVAAKLFKVTHGANIFNIGREVVGNIVFGDNFNEAGIAKIKALGGAGIIIASQLDIRDIPYILVEDVLGLDEYVGRRVKILNDEYGHYLTI